MLRGCGPPTGGGGGGGGGGAAAVAGAAAGAAAAAKARIAFPRARMIFRLDPACRRPDSCASLEEASRTRLIFYRALDFLPVDHTSPMDRLMPHPRSNPLIFFSA